jgi:hypothetical protein
MNALQLLPALPTREQIQRLKQACLEQEQAHGVEIKPWHHFAEGLVARTIMIPPGTVLVGAQHKAEHLNICHGDITVWTEAGMQRLVGYHVLPSLPGAERVGLAYQPTYWTTVHLNPDNLRDIEEIEDMLVVDAHQLQNRRKPMLPLGNKPQGVLA